jgi:hypothetical protein
VANFQGTFALTNSTITGNKAKQRGGGVYNGAPFNFTNSGNTFSGNSAAAGPNYYPSF